MPKGRRVPANEAWEIATLGGPTIQVRLEPLTRGAVQIRRFQADGTCDAEFTLDTVAWKALCALGPKLKPKRNRKRGDQS
jgi:hypothetical protein